MNRCLPSIALLFKRFLLCSLETMEKLCIYINSFVEIVITITAVTVMTITITVNRREGELNGILLLNMFYV